MSSSRSSGRSDDYGRRITPSQPRPTLNEYWIEGEGINRQVLQSEICKYLGAEATCRPGDHNGRPGFKIRALRPFTPDMLDDLRSLSREYMLENQNRALRGYNREEVPYEDSETRGRREPSTMDTRYTTSSPTISSYSVSSSVSSPYSDASASGYNGMPPSIYNPGSGYPPSVSYSSMAPPVSAMSSHVAPGDSRYPSYTYGQNPRDTQNYPPQYGYPPTGSYQDLPRSMHPTSGSYYPTAQGPSGVPRDQYYDSHMSGVETTPSAPYGNRPNPHGQQPYNPPQGGDYSRQRTTDGYGRR